MGCQETLHPQTGVWGFQRLLCIKWLGRGSFEIKLSDGKILYIDPTGDCDEIADLILISQGDYDHYAPDVIRSIRNDNTEIVCVKGMTSLIDGAYGVEVGDSVELGEIRVKTVKAIERVSHYGPKLPDHMEDVSVGFLIYVEGIVIWYASDSEYYEEMKEIKADVVLVPVYGTYTMNAEQAAEVVNAIKPKLVIPMNYSQRVGIDDVDVMQHVDDFVSLVSNVKVLDVGEFVVFP